MRNFLLLIIPLIISVFAIVLKSAVGPFWLGSNSDPSYLYLFNSLYIVDHITPMFVDHPGITLQWMGAAVMKILNWRLAAPEIVDNVLGNPEYYLNVLYFILLSLYILSIFTVGYYGLKKTGSILWVVFLQTPSFLFLTLKSYRSGDYVLPVIVNINAETLLITITNLFILCVIKLYFDAKDRDFVFSAVLFGFVCALGMTTKVSFLPLLLIPLILLPRYKAKLIFIGTFVPAWFLITIPIIPRYGRMYKWLKALITHTGFHGTGSKAFIRIDVFIQNLRWIITENAVLAGCLAFCLILVLARALFRLRIFNDHDAESNKAKTFLWVVLLALIVQFFVVAKQPSPQYMAPAVGLLGLLLGFLYHALKDIRGLKRTGFSLFLFLLLASQTVYGMHYQRKLYKINHDTYNFSQEVQKKYSHCVMCGYYRASTLETALYFGDDCFGYRKYSDVLKRKYPSACYWNRWLGTFNHFRDILSPRDLMQANECVLLYGSPYNFSQGFVRADKIETGPREDISKLTDVTAEQAVTFYLVAKSFEAKKDYKSAYFYALKAKEFGYPEIDKYLEELKGLINRER